MAHLVYLFVYELNGYNKIQKQPQKWPTLVLYYLTNLWDQHLRIYDSMEFLAWKAMLGYNYEPGYQQNMIGTLEKYLYSLCMYKLYSFIQVKQLTVPSHS